MRKLKNNLDNYFLNLLNNLSEINQFETFPNPCVGAVLVNKNKIDNVTVSVFIYYSSPSRAASMPFFWLGVLDATSFFGVGVTVF